MWCLHSSIYILVYQYSLNISTFIPTIFSHGLITSYQNYLDGTNDFIMRMKTRQIIHRLTNLKHFSG